ncbi:uncharacterized protein DDB_G0281497-like isoform X1 [Dreissena polymorpha]|uniref:RING-type domain-containing protein n=2 Tax=Dreissena polymorpha TaxID=45954 RepID=A0A9D4H6Y8_DREPO|nr:uncharacterized protein DDB_G0281497-like isoform X1 [Dreissena polymorpha]KAH3828074.1 hypothetical protein DPMN_130024 [Dreissena polymorpha]
MADSDLFALLEIMLRTFAHVPMAPRMKPGGYPEEIFFTLSEEEKESLECSICYQILKDARQCENKHKFCHSCIYVWSTSGSPVNHSRCPVCRVEGLYMRNEQINAKISELLVKCHLKTCKWKGPLKRYEEHQHNTYPTHSLSSLASTSDDYTSGPDLPNIRSSGESRPGSSARERARIGVPQVSSQTTESASTAVAAASSTSRVNHSPRRKLRSNRNTNNSSNNNRSGSVNQRTTNSLGPDSSTPNARARSQSRVGSSQRRSQAPGTSGTAPTNGRLTTRARIRNGVPESNTNIDSPRALSQSIRETSLRSSAVPDENSDPNVQTTTQPLRSPHPPSTPRGGILRQTTNRRLPALPDLVSIDTNTESSVPVTSSTDNNNNFNQSTMLSETPRGIDRRGYVPDYVPDYVRRANQTRSFGTIRERLNESRQRLDSLMTTFSSELNRGREDLTSFQVERERRRQEQMSEVRDLGRRLTQVANELRGLLTQRREIRAQIDTLADVASDDMD